MFIFLFDIEQKNVFESDHAFIHSLVSRNRNKQTSKRVFPGPFYLFLSIKHLTVNMFCIEVFRWLDSNRGHLLSEVTALPTEPQPLPSLSSKTIITYLQRSSKHAIFFDFKELGIWCTNRAITRRKVDDNIFGSVDVPKLVTVCQGALTLRALSLSWTVKQIV